MNSQKSNLQDFESDFLSIIIDFTRFPNVRTGALRSKKVRETGSLRSFYLRPIPIISVTFSLCQGMFEAHII